MAGYSEQGWTVQIKEKENSLKTKKKLKALIIKGANAQMQHRYFFLLLKLYDPPIRRPEVKWPQRGCLKRGHTKVTVSNILEVTLKIA